MISGMIYLLDLDPRPYYRRCHFDDYIVHRRHLAPTGGALSVRFALVVGSGMMPRRVSFKPPVEACPSRNISVLTFNVYAGPPLPTRLAGTLEGSTRLQQQIEAILKLAPDIVCLQEVLADGVRAEIQKGVKRVYGCSFQQSASHVQLALRAGGLLLLLLAYAAGSLLGWWLSAYLTRGIFFAAISLFLPLSMTTACMFLVRRMLQNTRSWSLTAITHTLRVCVPTGDQAIHTMGFHFRRHPSRRPHDPSQALDVQATWPTGREAVCRAGW